MKISLLITRALFGLTGVIQLILGIMFWFGRAISLVPLHMAVGGIFVLSLWVLSVMGARAGRALGLAATTIVWGLLLAVVGMVQTRLMPGPSHWVIRVLHLLMAVIAMGLGGVLTVRLRDRVLRPVAGGQTPEPRGA